MGAYRTGEDRTTVSLFCTDENIKSVISTILALVE